MKTKIRPITKFFLVCGFNFLSCNIGGGDIPTYVYDLRYKNKTVCDINIITYYKGEPIDNLKIKKKSTCYFSNIELRVETPAKNAVFKLNSGTYTKDSILVVSKDLQTEVNGKKFKKYIFINNEYREFENGYKYGAEFAFNLYSYYNKTTKRRPALALNKGDLVIINFEDKDFDQGLKMYDYESRGL